MTAMFSSLKNRLVRAIPVDTENGQNPWMLQISFEPENILVVADAKEAVPRFVHRRSLECFPTDACITAMVGSMLDAPVRLEAIEGKELELDTSVYQGLRKMPVDIFDNVYLDQVEPDALILVVDVRNFSNFLCNNREEDVFALIKDFTSNFLSCVNQFAFGCSYYKLMGDGAIIIWDDTNEKNIQEALQVFDTYCDFVNEELFTPYEGLGFAGALVSDKVFKYEISAEISQLKYRDYIGYGINLACRMQALAKKDELVINHKLASTGLVPYRSVKTKKASHELHLLKGLKEEDRQDILYYKP